MNRDVLNTVNLCLNAINCLILLVIIILTVKKLERSVNRKTFLVMVFSIILFNLSDCSTWAFEGIDAGWKTPALHAVTFIYFLDTPFMYIAFMEFIRGILKEKYVNNKWYIACLVPCIFDMLGSFASCYPGFFYTISAGNVYSRGTWHTLHVISIFSFYVFACLYLKATRKLMDRKTFLTLLSFPTLPTLCYIPQLAFYGIATVNIGLVVSVILMYRNLKNSIELGAGSTLTFASEYFQKKDRITFAEKVKRAVCSYGFSSNAIASIKDELRGNVTYSLLAIITASGILTAICFCLSFVIGLFAGQRLIYLVTALICGLLVLLFTTKVIRQEFVVVFGYLFFMLMFAANIYKCMIITPDESPMLFVCVIYIATAVFCDKPYLIWLLDYSAVFIYMDLARIYKPSYNAVTDSIYLFSLTTLGIIIGYGMSKTKITSIYLSKNLDNEVSAKTSQLNAMSKEIVTTLTSSIESKDEYTNGHSERVADYSVMIAERIGWNENKRDELWMEAILHDVGKIGVPDSILKKTSRLTDDEFKIIQSHTTEGAKILENLASFPKAKEAANYHHERINGKGYPAGLSGLDIPEAARIVAIADAYDAMTTSRCYRPALADDVVMQELKNGRGTQFDPVLLDVFLQIIRENGGSLVRKEKTETAS